MTERMATWRGDRLIEQSQTQDAGKVVHTQYIAQIHSIFVCICIYEQYK